MNVSGLTVCQGAIVRLLVESIVRERVRYSGKRGLNQPVVDRVVESLALESVKLAPSPTGSGEDESTRGNIPAQ